jgi:L-asparaginase
MERPSLLIIYTGGTIGMVQRPEDGALMPVNFDQLSRELPQLINLGFEISSISFEPALDSSNITPDHWRKIAAIIEENYNRFDGFVVLHGTDTMSYTASALSFMFENLGKPVIFTGSQLPIGKLRTDGKENILTAIEIAAARKNGKPIVPEVCIYFNSMLFRGNRTSKIDSRQFRAFDSKNYPPLAEAGVEIVYYEERIHKPNTNIAFKVNYELDPHVIILKIFPGLNRMIFEAMLNIEGLKGIVLEAFGSGNVPELPWFTNGIKKVVEKGLIVLNISQCWGGSVSMGQYQTSRSLINAGVISGYDLTAEAAVTKMMYLLGKDLSMVEVEKEMNKNIRGEITL